MLMGEHAVLHGYPAIIAAINQRIHISLIPRSDRKLSIDSLLGRYDSAIDNIGVVKPFQFVLAVMKHFQAKLQRGFDLIISSDIDHQLGLGSSAAVTVATLAVLCRYIQIKLTQRQLIEQAVTIIRRVQGRGSGADVAASVLGGIVYYDAQSYRYQQLTKYFFTISLVYCGHKVSTADILRQMTVREKDRPSYYQQCYRKIGEAAQCAWQAMLQQDIDSLAQQFVVHQQGMSRLELTEPLLEELIDQARQLDVIAAAKISGAGLGDCILTLGFLPSAYFPADAEQHRLGVKQLTVSFDDRGVCNE